MSARRDDAGAAAVDAHLANQPEPQKSTLIVVRKMLLEIVPEGQECIKYGMPCVTLNGKAIAGYDGFKKHCSYFPHSNNVVANAEIPVGYTTSKGTLQFPINEPLTETLLKKLVQVRIDELSSQQVNKPAHKKGAARAAVVVDAESQQVRETPQLKKRASAAPSTTSAPVSKRARKHVE